MFFLANTTNSLSTVMGDLLVVIFFLWLGAIIVEKLVGVVKNSLFLKYLIVNQVIPKEDIKKVGGEQLTYLESLGRFRYLLKNPRLFLLEKNVAQIKKRSSEGDSITEEEMSIAMLYDYAYASYIRIVALCATVIAIIFCILLQLDLFTLASKLKSLEFWPYVKGSPSLWTFITTPKSFVGAVFTGLLFSLGSAFWHDLLSKIDAAKKMVVPSKDKETPAKTSSLSKK